MADAITLKALQDASLDAKSLEEVVNGDEAKQVTTRKGESYPSVKKAIKTLFENGGLPATPFATKALMTASPLVDGQYALVTDDTVNNGLYIKTAGAWARSEYGIASALKDELLKHVSYAANWYEVRPPEASLWEDVTIVTGMYIDTASSTVRSFTGTSLAYMSVTAGKAYLFPVESYDLAACYINSPEDIKVGATLRQARLEGFQSAHPLSNKQIVVIPAGVEYLAFNVKVASVNFTQGAEIYEVDYFIEGLLGKDLVDGEIRDLINETTSTNETYPNLASAVRAIILNNRYVDVSSDITTSYTGARLEVVPVEKGEVYTIYTPNAEVLVWGIWDSPSSKPTGTLTPYHSLSALGQTNPNCEVLGGGLFQITIPETSGGFICFNTIIPSMNYNHSGEIIVTKGAYDFIPRNTIDTLFGLEVKDSFARKELSNLSGDVQINSPLSGKTWVAIGDSITEKNYRATTNYHDYVKSDVGSMTVYNYGISGTGFFSRFDAATKVTQKYADYVTIALGTNDWSHGNKELGDFLDVGTTTINGCINTTLTDVLTQFPKAKVAVITPLPRSNNWGTNGANNAYNYNLEILTNLLIKYCSHYSIPCLDLYHNSNLPVWIPSANAYYFTAPNQSSPDGLHPNDAGQRVMADKIRPFLESI